MGLADEGHAVMAFALFMLGVFVFAATMATILLPLHKDRPPR